jgi:hypothetical protein
MILFFCKSNCCDKVVIDYDSIKIDFPSCCVKDIEMDSFSLSFSPGVNPTLYVCPAQLNFSSPGKILQNYGITCFCNLIMPYQT